MFKMIAKMKAGGEAGDGAERLAPGVVAIGEDRRVFTAHMAMRAERAKVEQLER